jgi:hypothetical protein
MSFKVKIVSTITQPFNFGQLDRVADISWGIGLRTTLTAFVFRAFGKTRNHIFTALFTESAKVNMMTFYVFAEVFSFLCHAKHLSF